MFGRHVQTEVFPSLPWGSGDSCLLQEVSVCHRTEYGGFTKVRCQVLWGPGRKWVSRSQLEPLRPQAWAGPSAAAEVNIFASVPVPVAPGRSLGSGGGDTSVSVPSCPHSSVCPRLGRNLISLVASGVCVFHVFTLKKQLTTEQYAVPFRQLQNGGKSINTFISLK